MRVLRLLPVFALLLASCSMPAAGFFPFAAPTPTVTLTPTVTQTPAPTATLPPTFTPTPSLTPTPTWVFQSGKVVCPILLYHRVDTPPNLYDAGVQYFVSPEAFEQQMRALSDWGYTSVPITLLTRAITQGADLPPHPVVISFDDGDLSVYKNAYPVMQKYGFTGIVYIVANRLESPGFMHVDALEDLVAHGWEVGSHGWSHIDLSHNYEALETEVHGSRQQLESALKLHVTSFAYPFATFDPVVIKKVYESGYTSAVGVGLFTANDKYRLFFLSRTEIDYTDTVEKLASILPWQGPPTPGP